MPTDFIQAKQRGFTDKNRWKEGISHHPMSERLFEFIAAHDLADYSNSLYWKSGGDGDNGETLMYQIDAFFEFMNFINDTKSKQGV